MIQKQTDSATVRGPPGPTIIIYKKLIRVQRAAVPPGTPVPRGVTGGIRPKGGA